MSKTKDAAEENIEYALDGLTQFVLEGKVSDDTLAILKDIPAIKNVAAVLSIYGTVRNRYIAKKIGLFISTIQGGAGVDTRKLEELRKNYGDERILEEVVNRIDRLRSEAHAVIYANLYKALINEKINWDRFMSLGHSLELLDPTVLDVEIIRYENGTPLSWKYLNTGLAYTAPSDTLKGTMKILPNGNFFDDFWEYGLKPYQQGASDE